MQSLAIYFTRSSQLLIFFTENTTSRLNLPESFFTDRCGEWLTAVLTEASTHKMFTFTAAGLRVQQLALMLKTQTCDSLSLSKFLCTIVNTNIAKFPANSAKDCMWGDFHNISCGMEYRAWWNKTTSTLEPPNTQANTMLSQFVLRNVMKMALAAAHARKDKQQLKPVEVSEIRESEQQALRYVAGYIPYALTRHFKKFNKNTAAVVFVTVLESWGQKTKGITASSFLHFTQEWVNLVDRGGLIKVHDDVFLFFQRCEQITRNYLNIEFVKSNSDINFKEVIMNALFKFCMRQMGYNNTFSLQ